MMESPPSIIPLLPHHIQSDICTSRPTYRQGKKLTAVKVYTVSNESSHLIIFKVPAIELSSEIKSLCSKFGTVINVEKLTTLKEEEFTETYHVEYKFIKQARFAKKKLDNLQFYGGILHVCYAPELETLAQTRMKLDVRRKEVDYYVKQSKRDTDDGSKTEKRKRKYYPVHRDSEKSYSGVSEVSDISDYKQSLSSSDESVRHRKGKKRKHADSFLTKPYDDFVIPAVYPSQEVLVLPGSSNEERPNKRQKQPSKSLHFLPSVIVKVMNKSDQPSRRIVFHNK